MNRLFLLAIGGMMTLCSSMTLTDTYDASTAQMAVSLSQSTYCLSESVIPDAWDCASCTPLVTYETSVVMYGELAAFGYIGDRDSLFVAYRGTSNIQNWIDNVQVRQMYPYSDSEVGVEHGMYSLYASMRSEVRSVLDDMALKHGTSRLLITGHSLGGALATLTAFDLLNTESPYVVSDLITFGSPRVGNMRFAEYFDMYDLRIARVTHNYDMVPHVPETFMGYAHVRGEVWYNEDATEYTVCSDLGGEDPNCSNSCAPMSCTSVSDHLMYLNVSMGSDGAC